jgi:hypothetical protein
VCAATPAFSSRIAVRDFPSPIFGVQGALLSLLCFFYVVIPYYSEFFFFFSLGGGRSVQGAVLIWPWVVCGSTTSCLAHPVVCIFQRTVWALPSGNRMGALLVSPFSVKWRCYAQAGGVEESQFCLFLVFFFCTVYFQFLSKNLLYAFYFLL